MVPLGSTCLPKVDSVTVRSRVACHEQYLLASAMAIVAAFSLFYARSEPFFIDEYLDRITALAGSPGAVWRLLKTAPLSVDPPLYHIFISYWIRLFGHSEFATRVPSVLAYVAMTFLLFRFVRRYTDMFAALSVVLLPLLIGSFPYSYQARPYAVVLAADALALLCWATLGEGCSVRLPALVGLFAGISIAVGSHWFGFLVLLPLGIGEVVRTWQRRNIDFAVWGVLVSAPATAAAYLPLLHAAALYRSLPWKGVEVADIVHTFRLILAPAIVPLILLLVIAVVTRLMSRSAAAPLLIGMSTPVLVCIVVFALTPLSTFVVAKFVTHAFQARYALICVLGLLPLVVMAIQVGFNGRALPMGVALLIIAVYASYIRSRATITLPAEGDTSRFADVAVFSHDPTLPIVPGTPNLFLRFEEHAPVSVRSRCVFPTDADSVRYLHENTTFFMTQALRRWTNFPIVDLTDFLNTHPRFYLIQSGDMKDWLLQRLQQDHADIVFEGKYARSNFVYVVQVHR